MSDVELPPAVMMLGLISGFQMSQALFAVAELDVATALLSGPREVEDIATEVGADADALGRIIRFLAQHGVFRTSGSTVEITDLGRTLADGPADSLRSVTRYFHQTHYAPFGNLLDTVRTGEPAAKVFLGKPFFDWVNENPDMAALQNDAMAGFTQNARGDLLEVFDLPQGQTVADIGGADGTLLAELLAGRPERRGVVFDLPSTVSAARPTLRAAGLEERVEVVAGDFFEKVPAADVYVLSAVLQDWNNASSLRILRNVVKAAPAGARLVIVDMVVPEGDAPHPTKMLDIIMLGMLGGRQRSESEWRRLLADGGFTLQRVVTGSGSYSALEATLG
ncbi:methyltransferase [Streptosporangium sp. 'caverna']|uniref:methyltransferase n=1 Tax=Streptosporangium sp. 'caverna' TaxID=2202249 RepID=UPI0013A6CAD5|nr:methyltransferase [Streptosporangium sp. 'caverna']